MPDDQRRGQTLPRRLDGLAPGLVPDILEGHESASNLLYAPLGGALHAVVIRKSAQVVVDRLLCRSIDGI